MQREHGKLRREFQRLTSRSAVQPECPCLSETYSVGTSRSTVEHVTQAKAPIATQSGCQFYRRVSCRMGNHVNRHRMAGDQYNTNHPPPATPPPPLPLTLTLTTVAKESQCFTHHGDGREHRQRIVRIERWRNEPSGAPPLLPLVEKH